MAVNLRFIFPLRTACPACGDKRTAGGKHGGCSRSRNGLMEYRRCRACGFRYRVVPIAQEVDDGGAWSKVVPL